MLLINDFIESLATHFTVDENLLPWQWLQQIQLLVKDKIANAGEDFIIRDGIAIHSSAVVEEGAIIKAPAFISAGCFVAAHAYLRGGIYLANKVSIGSGCEIKGSMLFEHASIAHFNFIGDSIIGSNVNFEAGSITANHFNEREEKKITVTVSGRSYNTGVTKFGSLIGDGSKIGANAVLSPGTVLPKKTIVKRLELIDQNPK